ncbi:MAG: HEPN family nuclease [Acutalibacteraceae bacterium]
MEMPRFRRDFVVRTKEILENAGNEDFEYDVTLLINCLQGLICLPIENNKNEKAFSEICVDKLRKLDVIEKECTDDKLYKSVRNAVAHMHIDPHNENGYINKIVLQDKNPDKGREYHTILSFTVPQLKEFALFVADEYLKRLR